MLFQEFSVLYTVLVQRIIASSCQFVPSNCNDCSTLPTQASLAREKVIAAEPRVAGVAAPSRFRTRCTHIWTASCPSFAVSLLHLYLNPATYSCPPHAWKYTRCPATTLPGMRPWSTTRCTHIWTASCLSFAVSLLQLHQIPANYSCPPMPGCLNKRLNSARAALAGGSDGQGQA